MPPTPKRIKNKTAPEFAISSQPALFVAEARSYSSFSRI